MKRLEELFLNTAKWFIISGLGYFVIHYLLYFKRLLEVVR